MRRILVTGGRDYMDRARVFAELDEERRRHGVIVVIHGGASGADFWAKMWAVDKGVVGIEEKARWRDLGHPDARIKSGKYGAYDAMAGFRRNQRMLDQHRPDEVLAFPGGAGTADMLERAERAGVPVRRIVP